MGDYGSDDAFSNFRCLAKHREVLEMCVQWILTVGIE